MEEKRKPILCLDFDGVLHSYKSGWQGAAVIPDEPVPGAQEFCRVALEHFELVIFSSRCGKEGGMHAMGEWLLKYGFPAGILIAFEKPAAHVTLDDRAMMFTGIWPTIENLLKFQPWNKQPIIIGMDEEINPEALKDLYECCLSAKGAYEAISLYGIAGYLPGYQSCVDDLEKALKKAGRKF